MQDSQNTVRCKTKLLSSSQNPACDFETFDVSQSLALAYTRLLCEMASDLKTSDIRSVRTVFNSRGFQEIGEWRGLRDRLILPHRVTVDFDVHACDYPNKAVTNHGMRSTHPVSHECRHPHMVQCCLLQSTTWHPEFRHGISDEHDNKIKSPPPPL